MTLINSTVSENSAGGMGGGLYNYHEATLMLINSTVSENSASDGGDIVNHSDATLTLTSSIVDGNCVNSAPLFSNGYNIESPGDTCGFDQTGDQVGRQCRAARTSDHWQTTADRPRRMRSVRAAWPSTTLPQAIALMRTVQPLLTDQRGEPRPVAIVGPEPKCDVGAFELEVAP